jgi:hypothetical protein
MTLTLNGTIFIVRSTISCASLDSILIMMLRLR